MPGEPTSPELQPLAAGDAHPNLVFVMLDTLRADALAAYREADAAESGIAPPEWIASDAPMPKLDTWAREAAILSNVHGNSTWTRPSIASLLTGAAPEEHGATDRSYGLPQRFQLLAETLSDAGYRSAAFVSNWAAVGRDAGFDQGYEHFQELAQKPYARADDVASAVQSWLGADARLSGEAPLFLYIHYLDPHTPYTAGDGAGLTPDLQSRTAYLRELRFLDDHLVALLDELEARIPGDTLFLIVADHGEEFGEHAERGHGHALYRETGRLPTLLRGPGIAAGTVDARLEARALHALLLQLLQGPSQGALGDLAARLQPRVRRASVDSTTPSAWHRPYRERVCMRSAERDGKVVIWSGYGETIELYDLEADPGQTRNLARHEPELARALLAELDDPNWLPGRREPISHNDETFELLCALGYADCDDEEAEDEPAPPAH